MPGVDTFREDFGASVVVALVALPLCVGVAVASGVPAELGIVTGVVGGLVTGWFPGSSLQVSGPAAGLTVLVYEAVHTHGARALGVLVLAAGLLQLCMGALRLGRWFRAISVAVVHGMLAGIGLVLIAGQLYALGGVQAPAEPWRSWPRCRGSPGRPTGPPWRSGPGPSPSWRPGAGCLPGCGSYRARSSGWRPPPPCRCCCSCPSRR